MSSELKVPKEEIDTHDMPSTSQIQKSVTSSNTPPGLKVPKDEMVSPASSPRVTDIDQQPEMNISNVTTKPEYHLVPIRPNGPVYKLVYEGPAPKSWKTDPDWHRQVFSVNGVIHYQNEQFFLQNTN